MVLGVDVREKGSHKGGRGVEKLVSVLLSMYVVVYFFVVYVCAGAGVVASASCHSFSSREAVPRVPTVCTPVIAHSTVRFPRCKHQTSISVRPLDQSV